MSISLDNQPHRLGRRWRQDIIDKVVTDWEAGHPAKIIAKRLVASGIVLTPPQVYSIIHYNGRLSSRKGRHASETVEQMRQLWGDGWSAGRIGKSLGLSKNQVMGVVYKRGFQRRTALRFTLHDE